MSERKMVVCPGHTIFTSRSIAWRRKCELAVSLFKLLIVFTINHSFTFFTITTLNLPGKNVYNVISLENVCFGMHIYNKWFFRWDTHIYMSIFLSVRLPVCLSTYLMNCTPCDYNLSCTYVKWWYLLGFFSFFQSFVFRDH